MCLQVEKDKKKRRDDAYSEKKAKYAKQTKNMFFHAYSNYMVG